MKHVIKYTKNGKVTKKAINEALKEVPNLEFIDAVTGQWLTVEEARKVGVISLNVRYNQDRDLHVVKV
jgi:hypothetical protein